MGIAKIIVIVCLLLLCLFFAVKFYALKRQLRRFASEVKCRMDRKYNQPIKVDLFDEDVTKLAVVLNEHVSLQQRLAEQNIAERRELSNIVSGISHDFRTPLTAALGYLLLIEKSGELSAKNKEYLETAIEKNQYLKALSDDFFEISKLGGEAQSAAPERVNLSIFLSERLLEQYSWISENRLETTFSIEDDIIIESDVHCLERLISNLFSNAEKYAVRTLEVHLKRDGEKIVFGVYNGFEGIDEPDVSKVFEPFYRADSRSGNGSGLGLYVAKCLCDSLGYNISARIDSSRFVIEIVIK